MTKFDLQFTKHELDQLERVRQIMRHRRIAARREKIKGLRFAPLGTDHPALVGLLHAEEESERLATCSAFEGVEQWLRNKGEHEEAEQCKVEGLQNLELLKVAAIKQIDALTKVVEVIRALAYTRAIASLSRLKIFADFLTFTPTLLTIKAIPAIARHLAANAPNGRATHRLNTGSTRALTLER